MASFVWTHEAQNRRYALQGVVKPVTAVSCAAVALAPLFNWLFIFKWRLGLDGAVFAQLATWLAMLLMLLVFQVWYERRRLGTPQQTWHGW